MEEETKKTEKEQIAELENLFERNRLKMVGLLGEYRKIEEQNKKIKTELDKLKKEKEGNQTALTSAKSKANEFEAELAKLEEAFKETLLSFEEIPPK